MPVIPAQLGSLPNCPVPSPSVIEAERGLEKGQGGLLQGCRVHKAHLISLPIYLQVKLTRCA